MKNSFKLSILFILGTFIYSNAQVRVGGGVSVNIDLPFPEIVIGNKKRRRPVPAPQPVPRRIPNPQPVPRRAPAPRTTGPSHDYYNRSLGTINNQNRPDGNYLLQVVNAYLGAERYNNEHVVYELNNGETLEFIIQTNNPNDFNYHFYNNHHGQNHNNTIIAILLNGREIPVRDSALSLQPRHQGFHSVINLHTVYDGDFNGTVNL